MSGKYNRDPQGVKRYRWYVLMKHQVVNIFILPQAESFDSLYSSHRPYLHH